MNIILITPDGKKDTILEWEKKQPFALFPVHLIFQKSCASVSESKKERRQRMTYVQTDDR